MSSTDHVEEDGVQVIPESAPETSLRPAGASQMGGVEAGVDGGLRRASRDLGLHYPRPDAAPQLQYTFIEQTVSPGSPVNLKCSAVGSPFPLITWTRDHRPLHTSLRTNVGSFRTALGEVVSHVNLSDVTVRDGGTYACTAHNTLGSVSHSARVNVYGSCCFFASVALFSFLSDTRVFVSLVCNGTDKRFFSQRKRAAS
ncbi:putative down syndrome cell adhesion molecule [Penaeus vannamei]|uniref:Putative down syndrome cell adhesion molecule n=1 Tax=Penaeus vannamei TaxID=6689 RepID=A0A3R7N387_PENVA|nr:putative down syndrome cell adhesion molecule [Penaeus vannamei]